ncbi:hypothetical protein [Streptomyces sp. AA1529]|uniref:hypothetical protein n=1 Tax=Streptomyces sp. AA1529 TaxID=1203257 RepID=UPI003EB6EE2D
MGDVPGEAFSPPPLVNGCMWCENASSTYAGYARMPDCSRRDELPFWAMRQWRSHFEYAHPDVAE